MGDAVKMQIPRVSSYPPNSVQCDGCGGLGCIFCQNQGWLAPRLHHRGRKCENPICGKPLDPSCVAVYCSDLCAEDDA